MKSKGSNQYAQEKKYLDTLQRESWHLELIISGLALFGLVAAWNQLESLNYLSKVSNNSYTGSIIFIGLMVVMTCGIIVFINLLIHFLIRGLWIGAVGLRSVSGDIDFYQLKFAKRYQRFLRGQIGSFDDYVLRLDRFCSMIFAFSFLLAFLLVGFILYCIGISLIILLKQELDIGLDRAVDVTAFVLVVLYLLSGLVYFVDFLTLGWIKRKQWLAKIYYPVYRFFGFITMARIYRPLYYNFIDNAFGRKMIRFSIPYILLLLIGSSTTINALAFYQKDIFENLEYLQGKFVSGNNYVNLRNPDSNSFPDLLLADDVVTKPVLKVMINIQPKHDDMVKYRCPELPIINNSTVGSDFILGFNQHDATHALERDNESHFFDCIKEVFSLQLNDQEVSLDDAILMSRHEIPLPTLVKYVALDSLEQGMQTMKLTTYRYNSSRDTILTSLVTVPFYYHPDKE